MSLQLHKNSQKLIPVPLNHGLLLSFFTGNLASLLVHRFSKCLEGKKWLKSVGSALLIFPWSPAFCFFNFWLPYWYKYIEKRGREIIWNEGKSDLVIAESRWYIKLKKRQQQYYHSFYRYGLTARKLKPESFRRV